MDSYVDMPQLDNLSALGYESLSGIYPDYSFSSVAESIANGTNAFDAENIFNSIMYIFANELYVAVKILGVIIAVVMISAVLENLRTAFNKTTALGSEMIVVALSATLAGEIFLTSGNYATDISSDITKLMLAVLPALFTLTAGSGFTQTVIITNPIIYFMCNVFAELFQRVLIPLSVTYFAISLLDLITDEIRLSKLRELIKKTYNFILGVVMTLFTGLLGVSSFAGASLDSVGAKGVKFAVSNIVPFVGRSLSDAMGAVVAASVMLKNAVGITAIITLVAMCLMPVIKVAATIIMIRLSAAICEPVANAKTVSILSSAADSLSMINAAVIATVMMMVISISLIVGIK